MKSQFVGIFGKKYETFGNKVKKIAIRKGELQNIAEVEEEFKELKKRNKKNFESLNRSGKKTMMIVEEYIFRSPTSGTLQETFFWLVRDFSC